jgi:hypothetical protein
MAGFSLALLVLCGGAPAVDLVQLIRITVTIGTLAEMLMWAGFFWIPKRHRRLPLWAISRRVACFFFSRPALNGLLSLSAFLLLLLSLMFTDHWQLFVATSLLFLAVSFAVDIWRACYLHYWFMGLAALLLPDAVTSFVIITGSLYLWAGFFKLTSPLFHSSTATFTFKRVFNLLRVAPGSSLQYFLSAGAVAAEMAMGACFLGHDHLPAGLVHAFAWFNLFMHAYIVVFIGLDNGIHTFVPWNAMCVALSALLFGQQHANSGISLSRLLPHHIVLLFLLHGPPVLQIFGKNEFATLSHSWFVPSASGSCFLAVPDSISRNIPDCENGMPIQRLLDPSLRFDALAHFTAVSGDADQLFGAEAVPGARSMRRLVRQCAYIDGDWVIIEFCIPFLSFAHVHFQVDCCFRLRVDDHDPYNETFCAGPTGFWHAVAAHLGGPCLLLR